MSQSFKTLALNFPDEACNSRNLMQLIHAASRENRVNLFMMFGVFLLIAILNLFPIITLGYLIKYGVMRANTSVILPCTGVLLMVSLSIGLFTWVKITLCARFEIRMAHYIQCTIMKRLLHLPMQFFDDYTVGDLGNRVLIVDVITKLLGSSQMGVFLSFIFSTISFSIMMYFSWQLTLGVLCMTSVVFIVSLGGVIRTFPHLQAYSDSLGQTYGFMFQVISGIARIKLFSKEFVAKKQWSQKHEHACSALLQAYGIGVWRFTLFGIFRLFAMFCFFAAIAGFNVRLTPEYFMIYFLAFMQFTTGFIHFLMSVDNLVLVKIVSKRLEPVLHTAIDAESTQAVVDVSELFQGVIEFKQLYFKYPRSRCPILNGLDCSIPSGQHVAFVGLSGSGKSTLLKLLLGFYFPSQGGIYFNNKSIQDVDLLAMRRWVGVVLQDSQLIAGSILDNIIGHVDATEEEAWRVSKLVGLDVFILSLPMGMHTTVSQHAHLFSGGQKQLIFIARALVGEPRLLLLDEATNSLDNAAQERVVKGLNNLNITRVSVAHRLSTIKHADKIMVLHQGKIVETGTYNNLIHAQGFFYRFIKNQSNRLAQVIT